MLSMRQRVLLVAGWVLAAAVTSLVASAAVTVAGGRVTDRPLRPVAAPNPAPPAVDTESVSDPSEFLASRSFVCREATPSEEEQVVGQRSGIPDGAAGDELDADLTQENATGEDPTAPGGVDGGLSAAGDVKSVQAVSTPGGTVVVQRGGVTNGLRSLTWRPGYAVTCTYLDAQTLSVVFTRGDSSWVVIARLEDGLLTAGLRTGGEFE
jgi:hypothetical protein